MEHAKRLYLIDEFDREYKRVQRPSAVVAKAQSAILLDDTLRTSELDDHEKAQQYVAELHRYLNVTAPPPAVRKRVAARRRLTLDAAASRPSSSLLRPILDRCKCEVSYVSSCNSSSSSCCINSSNYSSSNNSCCSISGRVRTPMETSKTTTTTAMPKMRMSTRS